ncbi:MAG: phosphonate ABC transporter, permease protein PhnE [Oscillospiraceae bacterium]|jgi:phosphonate transport system permease protein|nr:phosphonate ABC transporter, permease protein PhnE [Oscillospiraceae bacterium]
MIPKTPEEQLLNAPKTWPIKLAVALIFVGVMAWSSSATQAAGAQRAGIDIAINVLTGIIRPDLDLLLNFTRHGVPYLLLETIAIAYLGTLVGAIIAIPLAFLSATNIVPKFIVALARGIAIAIRTIPVMIYALMFIRVVGLGPFAGLLTISLTSVGMVTKMYTEYIEDLDKGILEALDAMGCTFFQKIRYGVIPQLLPDFLSTIVYRFDMNLRDATVLGIVGAGGIGPPLIFAMNSHRWNEAGAVLIGLVVLIMVVELFSGRVRRKLTRGY